MMNKRILISGIGLLSISLIILGMIFSPVISAELKFFFKDKNYQVNVDIKKDEYNIIIPKIDAKAKVSSGIDPFNKQEYTAALKQGVAQAKGSSLPGKFGNIFIFAHSTDSPLNITQYNAIFYLLNKLNPGDEIFLMFNGKKYKYIVKNTEIADPSEIKYLKPEKKGFTLTLMTCWPPGSTLKRLLVQSYLAK